MPQNTRKTNASTTHSSSRSEKTSAPRRRQVAKNVGLADTVQTQPPVVLSADDDINLAAYKLARRRRYTANEMFVAVAFAASLTVNAVLILSQLLGGR